LSYFTERSERDGEVRGEPRDRINFKAAMLNVVKAGGMRNNFTTKNGIGEKR
jgi:hypothetical protein